MAYTSAMQPPPRYQSEPSSSPSQSENCGPTSVAFISDFYRDRWHGIEAARALISGMGPYNVNGRTYYGCPSRTPTNAWQQRDMLGKRGIPSTVVRITTVGQIHAIVDSARRPMLIGFHYGYIPDSVAGHTFQGWHAVAVRDGEPGYLFVMDPNFWTAGRDTTGGKRRYADAVVQHALNATRGTWAVVPNAAKVVAAPAPAPAPTPPPPSLSKTRADGDPHPMRFRRTLDASGNTINSKVKAGKPMRRGALVSNATAVTTSQVTAMAFVGRIPVDWLPASERAYGDVYFGPYYGVGGAGDEMLYVKKVDLA